MITDNKIERFLEMMKNYNEVNNLTGNDINSKNYLSRLNPKNKFNSGSWLDEYMKPEKNN